MNNLIVNETIYIYEAEFPIKHAKLSKAVYLKKSALYYRAIQSIIDK